MIEPVPPRILVAGCSDTNAQLIRELLWDLECRVRIAERGWECLRQLQQFQPHLVLIDSTLTEPDAFSLCKHIKNDHSAMVVIATALNELSDINRAVDAGTDDFISKPIDDNILLRRIDNLLKLQEVMRNLPK